MFFDYRARVAGPQPVVSTWMFPGVVRSIQTGLINLNGVTSNTGTLANPVVLANAMLFNAGVAASAGSTGALSASGIRITLTNTTTVTATRAGTDATAMNVRYYVVEFQQGIIRSIQRFPSVDINGGATKTQAITAVGTSKTALIHLGTSQDDSGSYTGANDSTVTVTLTSTVLVTLNVGTNPGVSTPTSFDVVEFY